MQESKLILHFSSDPVLQYRIRKIRSIIQAAKIGNVAEEPKELFTNLHQISPIPVLPLLQETDTKLTIAGSNPIIRYLTSITQCGTLYGGEDNFKKSLIDQWLDFDACELETIALAVELFISGRDVDIQVVIADAEKALAGLNKGLNKRKYLVGDSLTIADLALAATVSPLIVNLFNELERKKFTHIVNWFLGIATESKQILPKNLQPKANAKVEKWKNKGKKEEKGKQEGKGQKKQKKEKDQKKGKPEKQKKQQKVEKPKETGDDLFDNEPVEAPAPAAKPKPKKEPKKKPAAKSIIVFDVKVYQEDQDLLALFELIKKEIVMDGLVWNPEPKIEVVAYTMKKLQIGCVVEDEKVSIEEDVFERIRAWEDIVQSVDTVSFQKL